MGYHKLLSNQRPWRLKISNKLAAPSCPAPPLNSLGAAVVLYFFTDVDFLWLRELRLSIHWICLRGSASPTHFQLQCPCVPPGCWQSQELPAEHMETPANASFFWRMRTTSAPSALHQCTLRSKHLPRNTYISSEADLGVSLMLGGSWSLLSPDLAPKPHARTPLRTPAVCVAACVNVTRWSQGQGQQPCQRSRITPIALHSCKCPGLQTIKVPPTVIWQLHIGTSERHLFSQS